jgi:hypothetical protein
MKRTRLKAMTALSKFLLLLAIFLLAGYANAFLSLNQVAGNQVRVKYLIRFKGVNKPQQIKDWNGMQSFLISFHQNEESIGYRKSRMQSFQARLLSRLLKLLPTPLIHLRQLMV